MTEEHTPRPDDHLVEPMYEALREDSPQEPQPSRRGGCAGMVLLAALLGGLLGLAL